MLNYIRVFTLHWRNEKWFMINGIISHFFLFSSKVVHIKKHPLVLLFHVDQRREIFCQFMWNAIHDKYSRYPTHIFLSYFLCVIVKNSFVHELAVMSVSFIIFSILSLHAQWEKKNLNLSQKFEFFSKIVFFVVKIVKV